MVIASVGVGSAAHADVGCCRDGAARTIIVVADNCDPLRAGDERQCPDHGACHGHQVAAATALAMVAHPPRVIGVAGSQAVVRLVPVAAAGISRPPRA